MFENGVLRRIFRPKWEEVAGGWRRLHSEDLLHRYYYDNQFKEDGIGGACSIHGGYDKCIQNFGQKI
jgi:hypothetical protein